MKFSRFQSANKLEVIAKLLRKPRPDYISISRILSYQTSRILEEAEYEDTQQYLRDTYDKDSASSS